MGFTSQTWGWGDFPEVGTYGDASSALMRSRKYDDFSDALIGNWEVCGRYVHSIDFGHHHPSSPIILNCPCRCDQYSPMCNKPAPDAGVSYCHRDDSGVCDACHIPGTVRAVSPPSQVACRVDLFLNKELPQYKDWEVWEIPGRYFGICIICIYRMHIMYIYIYYTVYIYIFDGS